MFTNPLIVLNRIDIHAGTNAFMDHLKGDPPIARDMKIRVFIVTKYILYENLGAVRPQGIAVMKYRISLSCHIKALDRYLLGNYKNLPRRHLLWPLRRTQSSSSCHRHRECNSPGLWEALFRSSSWKGGLEWPHRWKATLWVLHLSNPVERLNHIL